MKVVFAGTPEFARVALARLHVAGFEIPLVLTQPDRPAGRGLRLQPSPVKAFALEHGIAVMQPPGLRLDGRHGEEASRARDALRAVAPDVIVVAAYGLILPAWLLNLPPLGCINIHASLLPRWRGAAPIHRAIEAGDAMTGVTIMQMDEGLDTGAMLRIEPLAIAGDDSTGSLQGRLAVLGGEAIVRALTGFEQLEAVAQPTDGVSYARKVEKSESRIDWRAPAAEIERRLRAFDPFPGATGVVGAETVKCWRGNVVPQSGAPGEVLAVGRDGLRVACGDLALELTQLQRAGGRRVGAAEFVQQLAIVPGMRFELPADGAGAGQRAEI